MPSRSEEYYTRSVTELAGVVPVTTCQDVYSTTGLKLVNKGVRLDTSFSEKLCQHSILPPLEQCLIVENGVDQQQLVDMARLLMVKTPALSRMAGKLQNTEMLFAYLRSIELTDPMVFLLTLARERRPLLLAHSITMALISLYIGHSRALPDKQMHELATAGLFHDLGELRIDSRLMSEDAHPIPADREQIYTHPATSQRMLLNSKIYSLDIINAVMRHHECIDGSGFPFGLLGSEMGELAKILSLAELIVTKLDEEARDGKERLAVAIKFNMQKYDAELLKFVQVFYEHQVEDWGEAPTVELVNINEIKSQITNINMAIEFWNRLLGSIPVRPRSASAYINQRLASLAKATREVGINTADKSSVINGINGDETALAELYQVNLETLQQIIETVFEVQRRWPNFQSDPSAIGRVVSGWMEYMQELLLEKQERVKLES